MTKQTTLRICGGMIVALAASAFIASIARASDGCFFDGNADSALGTQSAAPVTPVPVPIPNVPKPGRAVSTLGLQCLLNAAETACTYPDGSALAVVSCLQESGWLLCTMDRPSPPVEFQCRAYPRADHSWGWACEPYGGS